MRSRHFCALAIALTATFGASAYQAPTVTIAGRAVRSVNGSATPVRRAHVTIQGPAGARAFVADTDTEGRFRIPNVAPGAYQLTIEKAGFVLPGSPVPLQIAADASSARDFTLVTAGAIEGRLTIEGEPAAGFNVAAGRLVDGPNGPRLQSVRQVKTDDLGRFRIHTLPAGDYIVQAVPDPAQLRLRAGPGALPQIPPVFYPGTTQTTEAKSVHVALGQDARGLEFAASPLPPAAVPATSVPSAAAPARISGRVTAAATGRPVRGAAVGAVRWEAGSGTPLNTVTDGDGRFAFGGLRAGSYQVTVRADGFVAVEFGQRPLSEPSTTPSKRIELKEQESFEKADVQLPKPGAFEGTVLDEFGEPAPGISIQAARPDYVAGKTRLLPAGSSASVAITDDLGHFRLSGIPSGEYYLAALSGPFANEDRAGFAPTYFPGVLAPRDAQPVRLDVGSDRTDLLIPLTAAPAVTLSGRVEGLAPGGPGVRLLLMMTTGGDIRAMIFAVGATAPDGSFTFRNVPAGEYALQAMSAPAPGGAGGFAAFGSLTLSATGGDLSGLVVPVTAGATLRGHISFEGGGEPPPSNRVRISATPVDFVSGPAIGMGLPQATIKDDWTFEVPRNLGQGVLRPQMPAPWALKSITLNGRDVTDTALDFRSKDIDGLEIVMTSRSASIAGKVTDQNQPVSEYSVVIFADDRTKWDYPSRYIAVARPSQDGSYRVQSLLPGAYLVAALPVVGSSGQDPQFLDALRPLATRVALSEGSTTTADLKLLKR